MNSTLPISDLNGPLHCWGAARYPMLSTTAPRAVRTPADESAPFGDLSGPLSYWGPAPTASPRLARVA